MPKSDHVPRGMHTVTLTEEAIVVSVGEVLVEEETEEALLETEETLLEMEETADVILGFVQTLVVKSSCIKNYVFMD